MLHEFIIIDETVGLFPFEKRHIVVIEISVFNESIFFVERPVARGVGVYEQGLSVLLPKMCGEVIH